MYNKLPSKKLGVANWFEPALGEIGLSGPKRGSKGMIWRYMCTKGKREFENFNSVSENAERMCELNQKLHENKMIVDIFWMSNSLFQKS